MKIVLHSPFGSLNAETGLIHLLARYLGEYATFDLAQLNCDGLFPTCRRDEELEWQRSFETCQACLKEQQNFCTWSGVSEVSLSKYIRSEDVLHGKRLISNLSSESLKGRKLSELRYLGFDIYSFCEEMLKSRFGVGFSKDTVNSPNNKQQQSYLRKLLVSVVHSLMATGRFCESYQPDYLLVAGGKDFISRSLIEQAGSMGVAVSCFSWQLSKRCILISHPFKDEVLSSELLLGDLENMRNDISTWPSGVTDLLVQILNFLEIPLEPAELIAAS